MGGSTTTRPTPVGSEQGTGQAIVLNGLTKLFGRQVGISEVSLDIDPGQVFGFLGPNGAGKSTTIRLLMGLYRPTGGSCRVLGSDPTARTPELLRQVGYLPGELSLPARLTGREILDRFAHARGLRETATRDAMVERFGVDLRRPVRQLSKGNRQKIGLVLAFMHRPELLILDEPTSGLDPLLQDEFARLLEGTVAEGRTVFLSSHDLDEVQRVVHRLAIIKNGRVLVTDTVDGLRRRAPRTVQLRFPPHVDPRSLGELEGVAVRSCSDGRIDLVVTGPVAPLLRRAADLDVRDIVARPADLDELFLRYYGTGGEEARRDR